MYGLTSEMLGLKQSNECASLICNYSKLLIITTLMYSEFINISVYCIAQDIF